METHNNPLCSLAELYILDGLDEEEQRLYELHLSSCTRCQQLVRELKETSDYLLYDIPADLPPPQGMKERVFRHIFRGAEPGMPEPAEAGHRSRPSRRFRWEWGITAAAVLIAAYALGKNASLERQLQADQQEREALGNLKQTVVLQSPGNHGNTGKALIMQSGRQTRLILLTHGLTPPVSMEVYQVWLMRPGGVESAGTFVPAANGSAVFAAPIPNDLSILGIAITLEPDAYGKIPRGPKVLVGYLASPS
jgi:hypothetical protein